MAGQDLQSVSEATDNNDSLESENDRKTDIESGDVAEETSNKNKDNAAGSNVQEGSAVPETKTQMQSLEIEMQTDGEPELNGGESFEDEEGDMEHLLASDNETSNDKDQCSPRRQLICGCCEKPETVGNMTVFLPSRCAKTGWGIAGPHWFGPLCVLLLVSFASHYFIQISARRVGFITEAICVLFTLACAYNLGK